jgi:hypothetical protein
MSTPKAPDPAKLIISLFMNDRAILEEVLPLLEERLGGVEIISPWLEFSYTDYYAGEMGSPLFRRMAVFRTLVAQEDLAGIKLFTNGLEERWRTLERRSLNIDPGYLLLSRFVLATGKDYSHRIYLGQGIYADLTLVFRKGRYRPLEWTYPDYAGEVMGDFLNHVRERYALELRQFRGEHR